ncbi:helix-turn-helix domain-containing protein [Streptomyces sp. 372A]
MTERGTDITGPVPPPDPERARKEFAGRLLLLRKETGASQRELGGLLGVDHTTISAYEGQGQNAPRVPDPEYVDAFLGEVARRSDVTPDVLNDTRQTYGRLLRLLTAQPQERGRSYRPMLRIYELTQEVETLLAELALVQQQKQAVQNELESLRFSADAASASGHERQRQLEETAETLERRRAELVHRRDAVLADLDANSLVLRQTRLPAHRYPMAAEPAGGAPQQPHALPSPARNTRPRTATLAVVMAFVVAAGLGAFLIYRLTDSRTDTAKGTPGANTPTTTAQSTPTPNPTPSPTSPNPTPSPTSPSPRELTPSEIPQPDKIRWSGSVSLTELDLDAVPPKVLSSNNQASVWFSYDYETSNKAVRDATMYGQNGGFFTVDPTISSWGEQKKPTRKECSDRLATHGTESLPVTPGKSFCVLSAEGRISFITAGKLDKEANLYKGNVIVWENPEEQP